MARPRTATNILEARGAFKKHPDRKRESEPTVGTPFPTEAPATLTEGQAACWREIVACAPDRVLTGADVFAVEIAACLLAEWRQSPDDMPTARLGRLQMQMGKLGLDPSARASLVVDKPKKGEFDDL